jgi:SAM-dependent methyltransferase
MTEQKPSFDAADYWEKRLARSGSLQITGLSHLSLNFNRWIYLLRRTIFSRALAVTGLQPAGLRVLDIGSGTGFYIQRWSVAGVRDVTGVDISASAVRRLRSRFPESRFEVADAADGLRHVGEDFDAVSMFDVVYHVMDDDRYRAVFAGIYDVLAPGGWFLFSENFIHAPSRHGRHFVARSIEETQSAVTDAGFEIIRRRPMFVLMNIPVDARHAWQRTFWRRVTPLLKQERWGMLIGAALYPVDRVLTKLLKEGPTTEVMVCRKPL